MLKKIDLAVFFVICERSIDAMQLRARRSIRGELLRNASLLFYTECYLHRNRISTRIRIISKRQNILKYYSEYPLFHKIDVLYK